MALANVGLPGLTGTAVSTSSRNIFKRIDGVQWSDKLVVIDGSASRDPSNVTHPHILQAGLLMARDPDDGNKYKTALLGVVTVAWTSTTLTVGVGTATELSRRYGTSGSNEFRIYFDANAMADSGPADVTFVDVVHSAIDTAAGTLTVTAPSDTVPIGSAIIAGEAVDHAETADDIHNMLIVAEQDGIRVTNEADASVDVTLDRVVMAGYIDVSMILFYNSLTGNDVKNWLKGELNHGRQLIFSDDI